MNLVFKLYMSNIPGQLFIVEHDLEFYPLLSLIYFCLLNIYVHYLGYTSYQLFT